MMILYQVKLDDVIYFTIMPKASIVIAKFIIHASDNHIIEIWNRYKTSI